MQACKQERANDPRSSNPHAARARSARTLAQSPAPARKVPRRPRSPSSSVSATPSPPASAPTSASPTPTTSSAYLDADGYHYHVVNAGISGNTTKDGLDRVQLVIDRHPKIVVVEFGGNDGLRGLPIDQTQANLSSILSQLQASGAEVVLAGITLPPSYGPDYIKKFDAMYPALAKQYHIHFLPFLLKDVYGVPGDMQEDATHATAQGNQQVARNVEALLKPLLKK